jgi:hypothetical protein
MHRSKKVGTAAGRSTNVEPTKILFSGDGPALTPFIGASFQLLNGTRRKNQHNLGDE